MTAPLIPAVLRERASLRPDDLAFTFMDYEGDWNGVAHNLTWRQVHLRSKLLAQELSAYASIGDRAVILMPQSLEYIVAFLGSLEARLVAVPMPTPMLGAHDERVAAVLRDAAPSVILTTSSEVDRIMPYVQSQPGSTPAILEVDRLDLDAPTKSTSRRESPPSTAYLQYTSGSTRTPAGVEISHQNLSVNYRQITADMFAEYGHLAPPNSTTVSWLPFYHDMGLVVGVCIPVLAGWHGVFMTPTAFLQRPARWMQNLAGHPRAFSAAPNFAFDITAARTKDEDLAGHDLGDVLTIINGAERVHAATLNRFTQRFERFNLRPAVIRPSYGLAEATVYVATDGSPGAPNVVHFEREKLSAGHAKRCPDGAPLVSYGIPKSPMVRIVDPDTNTETPAGTLGEIWAHGDNVASGYWNKPEETEGTFGGVIVNPSAGTPEQPWLKTGDLGFISDGEFFIVGRLKDILVVRGRNHSPDDIEATVRAAVSGGKVVAMAIPADETENLVVIVEVKERNVDLLSGIEREAISAVSKSHGLSVADVVLVPPGSIPTTTSGKVRRSACVEIYHAGGFNRAGD